MNLLESVQSVLSKYATFSGRASRSELWWWYLASIIYQIVAFMIVSLLFGSSIDYQEDPEATYNIITLIISLPILLPTIAVSVRRLHDLNKSGWWYLLLLIPIIGPIVLIVWFIKRGTDGPNAYGQPVVSAAT